jgi:hypothetical protein
MHDKKFNRLDFLIRTEVHTKHLLSCVWSTVIITSDGINLNVSSGNEIFCHTCPPPNLKKIPCQLSQNFIAITEILSTVTKTVNSIIHLKTTVKEATAVTWCHTVTAVAALLPA